MKRLISSTSAKITAFMLSLVLTLIFSFSAFTILLMVNYQFYFSDEQTVKSEIMTDMAIKEASYISYRLEYGMNIDDYYKNKNVYYKIVNTADGDILHSNYNGEEFVAYSTIEQFTYRAHLIEDYEKYGEEYVTIGDRRIANITVYIAEDMKYNDIFSLAAKVVHIGFKLQYLMIVFAVISLGSLIALICFLFCAVGHSSDGTIRLNYLDRLPFDIFVFLILICVFTFFHLIEEITFAGGKQVSAIALLLCICCIAYCLVLGALLSIATRIKSGTLIKNTLLYRLIIWLKKPIAKLKYIFSNLSVIKKAILLICAIAVLEAVFIFYCVTMLSNYYWGAVLIPLILISLAIFTVILYIAVMLEKIKEGGVKLSQGNLDHKIETQYMFGDFKEFSENINNINSSLQVAVNERMKSERFKVELITNVSHDIKTPLTSIINYVDLIKKENPENMKINEYVEVLDRQSGRLKKLVEDLVEASKASSGNLTVNFAPCNIDVLLNQAIGEFEERLSKAELTPILKTNNENATVLADGRHLWRVFDNLLNNVCKYALEGTRVYITVADNSKRTEIIFRNISKYELNITENELMERFVRGDKSRHTEGHGLGLSITRSLLEIQGGSLEISVDGDLFKAIVIFNK